MTIFSLVALIIGCKTQETAPEVTVDPNLLKGPVPIPVACNDNDSDCPHGWYCNRDECSNYFGSHNRRKLFRECLSEKDCLEDDRERWICHRGRCRACKNAEECAPGGGETAGWFCDDGRCTTSPPPQKGSNPPVKDIPFPPTSSPGSTPSPPVPRATTSPAPSLQ